MIWIFWEKITDLPILWSRRLRTSAPELKCIARVKVAVGTNSQRHELIHLLAILKTATGPGPLGHEQSRSLDRNNIRYEADADGRGRTRTYGLRRRGRCALWAPRRH